jgi:outer membrane protein
MKKLLAVAVLALGLFSASAQNKIGYINTDELVGAMPETDKAAKDLQEYQGLLQEQNNALLKELGEQDSLFVKDSARLSEAQKTFRRNSLIELYQKVQGFSQKAQQDLEQRQQSLMGPIRDKALKAIKEVAKENGYAYILDYSAVIVGPPGDDVLGLVKKKLGIKETPASPAASPGTKPTKPGGN